MNGKEFDVIPMESNEDLCYEDIYVFKVTGEIYFKVLLFVKK